MAFARLNEARVPTEFVPDAAGGMVRRDLDLVHLARQTGGDVELEQDLLGLFADQCVRLLQAMDPDRTPQSAMQTRLDAAHTLKGAARAVGAWRVAHGAERVEDCTSAELPYRIAELGRAIGDAITLIERISKQR